MTYPSKHLMRISEVTNWLGVSKSWVYEHVKDGTFPEPIILARTTVSVVRVGGTGKRYRSG